MSDKLSHDIALACAEYPDELRRFYDYLWDQQLEDEKAEGQTKYRNGAGVDKIDAPAMANGTADRERIVVKYSRQLVDAVRKGELAPPRALERYDVVAKLEERYKRKRNTLRLEEDSEEDAKSVEKEDEETSPAEYYLSGVGIVHSATGRHVSFSKSFKNKIRGMIKTLGVRIDDFFPSSFAASIREDLKFFGVPKMSDIEIDFLLFDVFGEGELTRGENARVFFDNKWITAKVNEFDFKDRDFIKATETSDDGAEHELVIDGYEAKFYYQLPSTPRT